MASVPTSVPLTLTSPSALPVCRLHQQLPLQCPLGSSHGHPNQGAPRAHLSPLPPPPAPPRPTPPCSSPPQQTAQDPQGFLSKRLSFPGAPLSPMPTSNQAHVPWTLPKSTESTYFPPIQLLPPSSLPWFSFCDPTPTLDRRTDHMFPFFTAATTYGSPQCPCLLALTPFGAPPALNHDCVTDCGHCRSDDV